MTTLWQPGQLLFAGFDGTRLPPDLARLLGQGRLGGVVLFSRNVEGPEQLRRLVAEVHAAAPAGAPCVVAVDQEGGRVQRLRAPWTCWPPMARLGEIDDVALTRRVGAAVALELRAGGITWDFAPVADVDSNPENPVIGDRAFGRDPDRVARHVAAFVAGLQEGGVAACAKHFPGHGDTDADSHRELPRLEHDLARLRRVELPPFRAAVEAGVASVMTAHVLFPALDRFRPATLSPAVMELLRGELGYDGLVVSDDLEMKALCGRVPVRDMVRGALEASVDVLLVCRDPVLREEVLAHLERASDARLEPALTRLVAFKERFAPPRELALEPGEGAGPPYPEHQEIARQIARQTAAGGGTSRGHDPTEGPERR